MTEDSRTFTEIWASLTGSQKTALQADMAQRAHINLQTVAMWGLGYRSPKEANQELLTESLAEALNITASVKTLFPTSC